MSTVHTDSVDFRGSQSKTNTESTTCKHTLHVAVYQHNTELMLCDNDDFTTQPSHTSNEQYEYMGSPSILSCTQNTQHSLVLLQGH